MKTCSLCGIEQPHDQFYKCKKAPDGLSYRCKTCKKAVASERHRKRRADPVYRAEKYAKSAACERKRKAENPAYRARSVMRRARPVTKNGPWTTQIGDAKNTRKNARSNASGTEPTRNTARNGSQRLPRGYANGSRRIRFFV